MLIDWFTVLAQTINFLILILLLKRFLYGPIVAAMQKREDKIAARMEEAQTARAKALSQNEALAAERQALKNEKERLLEEARRDVADWRENALRDARLEIDNLRQGWLESIESEKEGFHRRLKTRMTQQVLRLSRKVLGDLADESLENRLIATFIQKLETEPARLNSEALHSRHEFLIRSGFSLQEDVKTGIREALRKRFPRAAAIAFETKPDFGFGIQLVSGDWKIEWNLAWYLKDLERAILPPAAGGSPA